MLYLNYTSYHIDYVNAWDMFSLLELHQQVTENLCSWYVA